jgi:uncharacterized membrane protein YbhN (UPF0104 family)
MCRSLRVEIAEKRPLHGWKGAGPLLPYPLMRRFSWKLVGQIAVTVLVVTFVAIAFWRPLSGLSEHDFSWSGQRMHIASGLAWGGATYLSALCCSLAFWWIAMLRLGQRPAAGLVPFAYFAGHLAKYVPGKALVVLLRAFLVRGPGCRVDIAAVTVIYDTLIFMAVGAVLAASVVFVRGPFGEDLTYWHIGLLLAALVPLAIPPIFNAIMRRLTAPFRRLPDGTHAPLPGLGNGLLALGFVLQSGCMVLSALSMGLVIAAVRPDFDPWVHLPALTAKLAAATVLGFIIPTPAGIGTREWALAKMLQADLGETYAALAAILTRLTWIASEGAMVGVLFLMRMGQKRANSRPAAERRAGPDLGPSGPPHDSGFTSK